MLLLNNQPFVLSIQSVMVISSDLVTFLQCPLLEREEKIYIYLKKKYAYIHKINK